jgi:hypothetical protein
MKNTMYLLFGVLLLISVGCEDKAGYPKTLSRPTIPDDKGKNPPDTVLNYNSEFKKHTNNRDTEINDSSSLNQY